MRINKNNISAWNPNTRYGKVLKCVVTLNKIEDEFGLGRDLQEEEFPEEDIPLLDVDKPIDRVINNWNTNKEVIVAAVEASDEVWDSEPRMEPVRRPQQANDPTTEKPDEMIIFTLPG